MRAVAEGNYIKEITEDYMVSNSICRVIEIVLQNEGLCNAFRDSYMKFSYLWTKDLQTTLKQFLEDNGVPDANGVKVRKEPAKSSLSRERLSLERQTGSIKG